MKCIINDYALAWVDCNDNHAFVYACKINEKKLKQACLNIFVRKRNERQNERKISELSQVGEPGRY